MDVAAVGLKLRFAGALRADGALARRARLTLQMRPHTDQARQQVLILRKLDLKPALFCLRPLGENVENQPAAVEHLHAEFFAQNAHLRGREVIVEDDHCRLLRLYQLADLVHLTLADKGVRIGRGQCLQHDADADAARRFDQRAELFKALLVGILFSIEPRRRKAD